jgi:uncharacterized protein YyaL (SSP411 family)
LRLAALTGEDRYEEAAVGQLRLLHELAPRHPTAFGHLLQAMDFHLSPTREVALAGDPEGVSRLAGAVREQLRPHLVLAGAVQGGDGRVATVVPLLEGREPVEGRAAAYVCERFACRMPVTDPDELRALLGA